MPWRMRRVVVDGDEKEKDVDISKLFRELGKQVESGEATLPIEIVLETEEGTTMTLALTSQEGVEDLQSLRIRW